jgi:hypothetical protein
MQAETRSFDQRSFSSVIPLAIWTLLWVGTVALANFGPALWDRQPVLTWIAIGVNVSFGVGWMVIHARYLGGVDELQRKIMLDAVAVALGVGLVAGFAYASASTAGLLSFDSDIAFITVLMAIVYIVAVGVGQVRYR